jgi:hypothetical protein
MLAAAGVLALGLTACTPPTPGPGLSAVPAPTATEAAPPSELPSQRSTTDDGEPARCTSGDRDGLRRVVNRQLDAITEGRWEDALTFSTPSFRDGIDADSFAAIILEGFPVVARATAADATTCVIDGATGVATMAVTVTDVDGAEQALTYIFEQHAQGWLIGGALKPSPPTAQAPTVTV